MNQQLGNKFHMSLKDFKCFKVKEREQTKTENQKKEHRETIRKYWQNN